MSEKPRPTITRVAADKREEAEVKWFCIVPLQAITVLKQTLKFCAID